MGSTKTKICTRCNSNASSIELLEHKPQPEDIYCCNVNLRVENDSRTMTIPVPEELPESPEHNPTSARNTRVCTVETRCDTI